VVNCSDPRIALPARRGPQLRYHHRWVGTETRHAMDHMAARVAHDAPPRSTSAALLVAALLPFVVYTFSASGSAYLLDSGEFTAQARWLGVAHPPGHPLAGLWNGLFALLPCGPLSFRVALAQAAAGALTSTCVARACLRIAQSAGLGASSSAALACATALSLAGSYALWFQSIRAEVYALEAMLVAFALDQLAAALAGERRAARVYLASFALGLGLANHHLVALLAVPCVLVPLVSSQSVARIAREGLGACGAALVGLSAYAYLPLRAAATSPLNLGDPQSLARFWWVVSAQVYARNIGTTAHEPLATRLADLSVILVRALGPAVLLLAFVGTYAGLRARPLRAQTALWLSAALINLGVRTWLGPIRANPDILGYMLPGLCALSVLAALGAAALAVAVRDGARLRCPSSAALVMPVLAALRFPLGFPGTRLDRLELTDTLTELRLRTLPPRSLVVLVTPQAAFMHWAAEASEALRPDVDVVPVPFLGYPGVAEALLARAPELAPWVARYREDGTMSLDALLAVAETRPVRVELDPVETRALHAHLTPARGFWALARAPVTADALMRGLDDTRAELGAFSAALEHSADGETRAQALWAHYSAALRFAEGGARSAAAALAEAGLAQAPDTPELVALRRALDSAPEGVPLDVTPFLPGAP
jgi:Protein of unknown function (DUF2723)